MDIKENVIARLRGGNPPAERIVLAAVLTDAAISPVSAAQPRRVAVSDMLDIWSIRLANTQTTGRSIAGAQDFLDRLRRLDPRAKLEQFGFIGNNIGGNVYFDEVDGAFVGAVFDQESFSNAVAKTLDRLSGKRGQEQSETEMLEARRA